MIYFTLTGNIDASNTQALIYFFNNQIIDNDYTDTLTIFLSSIGGDIDAAVRVYDFLKSVPNKVHTIGFGQIDSAAITIFLAGDKRTVLKKHGSDFMNPPIICSSQIQSYRFLKKEFDYFNKSIKE